MTHIYFVTGTDTDCGKTYITTHLLRTLQANNKTAQAIKPIASGCYELRDELLNEDVIQLQRYNSYPLKKINRWAFKEPIAPHIAAKQMNIVMSAKETASFCMSFVSTDLDYLLIEGAGGLLVPLNDKETWVDLLKQDVLKSYDVSVILVIGLKLGCINHALLTESFLLSQGIACKGFIINEIDPSCLEKKAIKQTLIQRMRIPFISSIPYCGSISFSCLG